MRGAPPRLEGLCIFYTKNKKNTFRERRLRFRYPRPKKDFYQVNIFGMPKIPMSRRVSKSKHTHQCLWPIIPKADIPTQCWFCHERFTNIKNSGTDFFVWGLVGSIGEQVLCGACFQNHGSALGVGIAQKYSMKGKPYANMGFSFCGRDIRDIWSSR